MGIHKKSEMKYKLFLGDTIDLIKRAANEAIQESDDAEKKSTKEFNEGRAFAYFETLCLLKSQGESFKLSPNVLELDFEVERAFLDNKFFPHRK